MKRLLLLPSLASGRSTSATGLAVPLTAETEEDGSVSDEASVLLEDGVDVDGSRVRLDRVGSISELKACLCGTAEVTGRSTDEDENEGTSGDVLSIPSTITLCSPFIRATFSFPDELAPSSRLSPMAARPFEERRKCRRPDPDSVFSRPACPATPPIQPNSYQSTSMFSRGRCRE